jgi:hypothetical protein
MTTVTSISKSNVVAALTTPPVLADSDLRAIRAQAALVRSLLDELDDLAPPRGSERFAAALAAQTVEELAQLACRMMAVASSMAPQCVAEVHIQQWTVPVVYSRG